MKPGRVDIRATGTLRVMIMRRIGLWGSIASSVKPNCESALDNFNSSAEPDLGSGLGVGGVGVGIGCWGLG